MPWTGDQTATVGTHTLTLTLPPCSVLAVHTHIKDHVNMALWQADYGKVSVFQFLVMSAAAEEKKKCEREDIIAIAQLVSALTTHYTAQIASAGSAGSVV